VAIYFFQSSKTEEEEHAASEDEEGEIDSLVVEREADGKLTFESFIEIFRFSSRHAKSAFAAKRQEFVAERRQAGRDGDEKRYREIVEQMTQEEERLINDKLM
jgi:hypothetical protein